MKLVCLSDTHNLHSFVQVPNGDVVIHAGDWTGTGTEKQVIGFTRWFASLPHKHKILIAGNHEITFDEDFYDKNWTRFHKAKSLAIKSYVLRESSIHYLENQALTIDGVSFYGSPVTPTFFDWGFNVERGDSIKEVWSKIPTTTDVLITHGPPHGFGDELLTRERVGCESLLDEIKHRIKPKVHIFGHIHNGYGLYKSEFGTLFVNASICDEYYGCPNKPLEIDLSKV